MLFLILINYSIMKQFAGVAARVDGLRRWARCEENGKGLCGIEVKAFLPSKVLERRIHLNEQASP